MANKLQEQDTRHIKCPKLNCYPVLRSHKIAIIIKIINKSPEMIYALHRFFQLHNTVNRENGIMLM